MCNSVFNDHLSLAVFSFHVAAVMQGAVNNSIFGWDPTSIYLLLTDPLVSVQYHCSRFCAYTDTFTYDGQTAFF